MKWVFFVSAGWFAAWAAEFLRLAYSSPPGVARLVGLAAFGLMVVFALDGAAEGLVERMRSEKR